MTIRLRRLGQELKHLRVQAGFTQEQVAERMECSKGRIMYAESGKGSRPSLEFIRALLDLYNMHDETVREALVDLARRGKQKGWWTSYADVFPAELPGWEEDATVIRTYDSIIPGLLQTSDYATALFDGGMIGDRGAIKRNVDARMRRQSVLRRDPPPQLWVILDETALRRVVGDPKVMHGQLLHLLEMASRPNITIQVLPFEAGAHAAMTGTFYILDFGGLEQPPLVYVSTAGGSAFLEKPEEVERCTLIFGQSVISAKSPRESITFITDLADHLKG